MYKLVDKVPAKVVGLSSKQKRYLLKASKLLSKKKWSAEDLQQALYELSKKEGLSAKLAFQAIYMALSGKKYGPKAGWFVLDQGIDRVISRLQEVQDFKIKKH